MPFELTNAEILYKVSTEEVEKIEVLEKEIEKVKLQRRELKKEVKALKEEIEMLLLTDTANDMVADEEYTMGEE